MQSTALKRLPMHFMTVTALLLTAPGTRALQAAAAPPSPPTSVTAFSVADDAIRIEWAHSGEDVVRFVVFRAPAAAGPYDRLTATPRSRRNYTDVDLSPSTTYCYRVEAENNDGATSSGPVCAETQPPRPTAPTGLEASQVEGSPYIDLRWNAPSDDPTLSFVVYRQIIPDDLLPLPIDTVGVLAYRDGGARNGIERCYAVSSLNASGESAQTDEVCLFPEITPVVLPSEISAFSLSATSVSVSWSLPVYNYATLTVERSAAGGPFTEAVIFDDKTLSYSDEGLNPDTEYCYRLRATNEISLSEYSSPVCARTGFARPSAPVISSVEALGGTQIEVTWTGVDLPSHWHRVRRRTGDEPFVAVSDSSDGFIFVDSDLDELTEYCYDVQTYNPQFESARSGVVCAQTELVRPSEVSDLAASPDPVAPTTGLDVSWSPSTPSTLTSYKVEFHSGDDAWLEAATTVNTFARITGLDDAVVYTVRVTAIRTMGDLSVSSAGVSTTARTFLAHWPGDANGDGSVTAADVVIVTSSGIYGAPTPFSSDGTDVSWRLRAIDVEDSDPDILRSDTDRNGRVELFDVLAVAANAGKSVPSGSSTAPALAAITPEQADLIRLAVSFMQSHGPDDAGNDLLRELELLLRSSRSGELPEQLELEQNFPNPFNPSTSIDFALPESGFTELVVYNALGQTMAVLASDALDAGRHTRRIDASAWPSGLYVYVLSSGSTRITRSMTLLR